MSATEKRKKETDWRKRYSRQLAMPAIGDRGQTLLNSSAVLLVGAGGLGSAAGLYLAAAGIGTIGIVDNDKVEISNLQRQIIHRTRDIGRPKVVSAARALRALNPDVQVLAHRARLSRRNAATLVQQYDFVIDATDNFPSKFLIADACHAAGVSCSHAGIAQFEGQTLTVLPGKTACYRCLFEASSAATRSARPIRGPLGAVPGVIGSIQAIEAVKYLVGIGRLLTDRLLVFDALEMEFRTVSIRRNPSCPLCGSISSKSRIFPHCCGRATFGGRTRLPAQGRRAAATARGMGLRAVGRFSPLRGNRRNGGKRHATDGLNSRLRQEATAYARRLRRT